jgi:hypothetical protein
MDEKKKENNTKTMVVHEEKSFSLDENFLLVTIPNGTGFSQEKQMIENAKKGYENAKVMVVYEKEVFLKICLKRKTDWGILTRSESIEDMNFLIDNKHFILDLFFLLLFFSTCENPFHSHHDSDQSEHIEDKQSDFDPPSPEP